MDGLHQVIRKSKLLNTATSWTMPRWLVKGGFTVSDGQAGGLCYLLSWLDCPPHPPWGRPSGHHPKMAEKNFLPFFIHSDAREFSRSENWAFQGRKNSVLILSHSIHFPRRDFFMVKHAAAPDRWGRDIDYASLGCYLNFLRPKNVKDKKEIPYFLFLCRVQHVSRIVVVIHYSN